jgi:hypothetical protein
MVIALAMKSWFGPFVKLSLKRHGTPGWLGGETRPLEKPGTGRPVAGSRGTAADGKSTEQVPLLFFSLEPPLATVSSYAGPLLVSRWSFRWNLSSSSDCIIGPSITGWPGAPSALASIV